MKINFKGVVMASVLTLISISPAISSGVLHRGNGAEPGSIDPHFVTGTWENTIAGDMFMGLTVEASDGKIIPGLAESWKISNNGKKYTFKIREGAKWSDGKLITAYDFEFSFKRILAPKTAAAYAFILYPIKNAEKANHGKTDLNNIGIKAIDASTLEIKLENITPYFLEQLAHFTAWAVPMHIVKKYGKNWTKKANIVVSGAFIMKDWKPQTSFSLTKNPMFYDAKNVKLDGVVYYPIEDANSEFKRYRAGDIDISGSVPSGQFKRLKKKFAEEFRVAPSLGVYYYSININKIKDIRIRKALSMAINRDIITQKILGEGQKSAYSFVPPGINNYVSTKEQPSLSFGKNHYKDNLIAAKKLMKEAGYSKSNPYEVVLKYNTSEAHKKIAVAIFSMWKSIGVKTELFNQETKVHYANLQASDFQVGRAGWIGDYNDPTTFTDLFLDNQYNYSGYINKDLIANSSKASTIIDLKKRAKALMKVERLALDGYSTIPIYYYVSKHLVSSKVTGWKDNIMDIHRSRWLDLK